MPNNLSTRRKVRVGFAFALVCVGVVGIMSYLSVSRLREDEEWTGHNEEVISTLRGLLSHVTDGETGQRGYAIAGEEVYLEPYLGAQRKIHADLKALRRFTSDNAAQQNRLDILTPLVESRLARLDEEVKLRRSQGFAAAQAATLTGVGKALHDQIRRRVTEMETAEQGLLQRREDQAKRSLARARAIIIGGSALALGVVVVALRRVGKDLVRRRAQAAQIALAARLTRMGAWWVELPGFKLTWSDEVCAIHDVPPGFAPPVEQALNYYTPQCRETIAVAFGACVRDGTPFDTELELISAKGRRVWVRSVGEAERNAAGAIVRVQGAFQDITERRRAEEALRKAEEDFRMMANNISQLAWMADATGSIFWYNDRWYDYSGTTLEEMAGWGWQKVHHPDHVEAVAEKISRCFRSGEVWDDTFPLRGRDGAFRWFLSRAVPIRDAEGNVLRWFGTNTDVTEIKTLQAELAVARDQAIE
jgi:PAS domain S-box-containing protein